MKKIEAKIVADSLNSQGNRITTFLLTYPRFIHSELMTHRMFSRNSASSRAIPFEKMVKMVEEDPFIPIAWQKQHIGMQGSEYFQGSCKDEFGHLDRAFAGYEIYQNKDSVKQLTEEWLEARDNAIQQAKALNYLGVTKQLCNRLLEPFMWHTVLITATEFENFFELRCPQYETSTGKIYRSKKDWWKSNPPNASTNLGNLLGWLSINKSQAEIHIQALAEAMYDAMNESTPKQLKAGEWHIPMGDNFDGFKLIEIAHKEITKNTPEYSPNKNELQKVVTNLGVKIATARCARISYQTLGDNPKIDYEADIKLHDRLLESRHLSCFEHCARAMSEEEYESFYKGEGANKGHTGLNENKGWCNNFRGFIQYRYLIENNEK